MKTKILNIFFPTTIGILVVLGFMIIFNLIFFNGDAFYFTDNGFLKIFMPIAYAIALITQLTFTIPFWEKFKTKKKVWGLTSIQFISLLCLISGIAFGIVFWETNLGINELFLVSLTGIFVFTVYWIVNLLTLKLLSKLEK